MTVLQVELAFLVLLIFGILTTIIVRAPRTFRDEPKNVLICCAHSDDCVIAGAEYAYGSVRKGLSVRIAYLTCSAARPESEIAQIRKQEAIAAWSTFGIPDQNLTFINLSESPVRGPISQSRKELLHASRVLVHLFMSLPEHAVIIVPAEGESHVDHRTVRRLSMAAIAQSKRKDITIYETPEYNNYLSFVQGPHRAIRTLVRYMPLLNRLVEPYNGAANYVSGPPGFIFRDTPNRLLAKRTMLRCFHSQNGDRLAENFGHHTLYRKIPPRNAVFFPRYISAFGACSDLSTICLGLALLALSFFAGYGFNCVLSMGLSGPRPLSYILAATGFAASVAYLMRVVRGTISVESALFVWATALGLISSLV